MTHSIINILIAVFFLSSCGGTDVSNSNTSTNYIENTYPEQSTSPYNLPYLQNLTFLVGQGNNTNGSHTIHTSQAYAYDFDMPIGTNIIAVYSGIVIVVVERFKENNNVEGEENYLIIKHTDKSISAYYHITENGSDVEVGESVQQGDVIAQSGNTGNSSQPHLHFEVALCEDCQTLPVNFKNTRTHSQGLNEGEFYRAE